MASQTFTITYPNGKGPALLAAMRHHYGQKTVDDQGNPIDPPIDYTPEEIRGFVAEGLRLSFKNIYAEHQRYLQKQTAIDEIDPTADSSET